MSLDRETVVRTALRLLDELGLERLTLRRIAAELDVRAPALYWHFRNKQELLDAMATTVLTDSVAEHESAWSGADWREFLRTYALGLRRALLRYRDGAKMVPGTRLTDASMYTAMEKSLRALIDAGFTAETASAALGTVYSYTVGHAIEEQAVRPPPGDRDRYYDPQERRKRLDPARQPTVAALNDTAFADPDASFDDGLQVIVDGLTTRVGATAPIPPAHDHETSDPREGSELS